jgi:hypothetical protein
MARVANNELGNGWSDSLVIKHGDLTATGTTQTFTLPIPAGGVVRGVGFYLETAFDGGSTNSLTIDVGDGDDPDGYIDGVQIAVDATEVIYAWNNGDLVQAADVVNHGKLYTAADTLDILLTGSHALNTIDTGKINIFVDMLRCNPEA